MDIFVFDIETIPDTQNGKKIFNLPEMSQENLGQAMFHLHKQHTGSSFLPHYLQKIIAISLVLRSSKGLKIWSLGDLSSPEEELIERFFKGIETYSPILVSWNGCNFDLPVLHYRALLHGIHAARYWDCGEYDSNFKWNNYLNRYHERHTDLMDVLSGYQTRAVAPLDKIASMIGFPGKMGMSGDKVWGSYLRGEIESIRNYCETDVLNTYLVYLRYQLIRGKLSDKHYEEELDIVKATLSHENRPHFAEFLANWEEHEKI